MSELLQGEFAIRCFDTSSYISYANVAGNNPFLDTSGHKVTDFEKFRFTAYSPQYTLIQTLNLEQYVTVPPEGGLILTDELEEASLFTLIGPQFCSLGPDVSGDFFGFNIRTINGAFVSAVNGGNMAAPNAFLTEVTVAQDWEAFAIVQAGVQIQGDVEVGELGSGYRYTFKPVAGLVLVQVPIPGLDGTFTLIKAKPPGITIHPEPSAIGPPPPVTGAYVFQLSNGFNYLTAAGSGAQSGPVFQVFHNDAWNPLSWEVFNITPNNLLSNAVPSYPSYFIQTASGLYFGYNASTGTCSTDIADPDLPPDGFNTSFEFSMVRTPVHGAFITA
jgi:hypothetical protein